MKTPNKQTDARGGFGSGVLLGGWSITTKSTNKMSKQSDSKLKQGWSKTTIKICANCKHFSFDSEIIRGVFRIYQKDINLRCTLGCFKTGKSSTCNDWCANPPNASS